MRHQQAIRRCMHMPEVPKSKKILKTKHQITAVIINKASLFKKGNNLCTCKQTKTCYYFDVISLEFINIYMLFMQRFYRAA